MARHERRWTDGSVARRAALLMRDAELWTPERTVQETCAPSASAICGLAAGLPPAGRRTSSSRSGNPPPVNLYSFGGEAMPRAGFDKVRRRSAGPVSLINGYGPTETVVTPLVWKVDGCRAIRRALCPDRSYRSVTARAVHSGWRI